MSMPRASCGQQAMSELQDNVRAAEVRPDEPWRWLIGHWSWVMGHGSWL